MCVCVFSSYKKKLNTTISFIQKLLLELGEELGEEAGDNQRPPP